MEENMFLRSLVTAVTLTICAVGVTAGQAQNATVSGSASASTPPATIDTSGSVKTNQGTIGASSRAEGRIEKADRRKGGRVGKDGSLPKPKVKDDPQHRCLAPSGIC
jgi:hypothetical protein